MDSGNYTAIIRNIAGEKLQKVWIIVSGNYTHNIYEATNLEHWFIFFYEHIINYHAVSYLEVYLDKVYIN